MRTLFQQTRFLFTLPFLLISACSFSPGFHSGESLDHVLGDKPARIFHKKDTVQQDPIQGAVFVSNTGVKVTAYQLTSHNLPEPTNQQVNEQLYTLLNYQPTSVYRLAQGDVVSFYLWGYPEITPPLARDNELTAGITVSENGMISLPLIGNIRAAGKSMSQLQRDVTKRYRQFLKNPDVSMKLLRHNSRRYYVLGNVKLPGEYIINSQPANLMTAISKAGGAVAASDMNNIQLSRGHRTYRLNLHAMRKQGLQPTHIYLKNNDIINVGDISNRRVYLLGESKQPKAYTLPENGWKLSQLIGESGGINSNSANPSKVYVLRDQKHDNSMSIYRVDLSQLNNFALASRFELMPNDIVYIDATGLAKWNRIVNLILPSTDAIRSSQVITGG